MWVSRPGLGLETDQDHFFEVLVSTLLVFVLASAGLGLGLSWRVVLSKTWGYVRPQRYWCRKSKLASECAPLFTYLLFDRPILMFLCIITFTAVQYSNVDEWKLFVCAGLDPDSKGLGCWSWSRPCWSWSSSLPPWSWSRSVWSWTPWSW